MQENGATLDADGGPRPELAEARPGDVIADRYELISELGRGAYGVVYRAHDRVAGAEIAVKVLGGARRLSPVAAERLRRELRAAWTVTHPGVVRIHDLIVAGDHLALSMELVAGETLDAYLTRKGQLAVSELRTLAAELAGALAAAHVVGVTHRDLKPSNIMIRTSGRAVITDFGLSRISGMADTPATPSEAPSEAVDLTRTGELLGTPAFMAPEQLRGDADVGPAADVYALGLVLFEVATGVRPHPHETLRDLMRLRLEGPPPRLATLRADLPADLARVIEDCLAIDVADRISDGVELVRRFGAGGPPRRPRWRWWLLPAPVAVAIAAVVVLAGRRAQPLLPAHDRHVAFVTDASTDLDRALAGFATRLLAHDRHIRTVPPSEANVSIHLAWRQTAGAIDVSASVKDHVIATGHGDSIAAAFEQARPQLLARLDADQPILPVDANVQAAITATGARDADIYYAYQDALEPNFRTSVVDVPELTTQLEAVIARDPTWAHPYALLMDMQGAFSDAAEQTRLRALKAVSLTQDPVGNALLKRRGIALPETPEEIQFLDDAFRRTPDDIFLGWYLYQVLLHLHRDAEAVAVVRLLHSQRPDLQFGTDLEQTLRYAGKPEEIASLQQAWLQAAPEAEQAWMAQIDTELGSGRADAAMARAQQLVLMFGRSPQRLMILTNAAIVGNDLPAATATTNVLLRGSDYERVLGWYMLGEIEILQGHFSGAREAWRASLDRGLVFGTQGLSLQSLEEMISLDQALGERGELRDRLDQLIGLYGKIGDAGRQRALEITRGGLATPPVCPSDLPALVRPFKGDSGVEGIERGLWRAAADAGCAPCSEVVRLGGSPDERSVRSLYRFAICAEHEGALELARDSFTRASQILTILENSSTDPATAYAILADFHLGRVLARLGRRAEARAAYERFLSRWQTADRPVPEVDEARSALATLSP